MYHVCIFFVTLNVFSVFREKGKEMKSTDHQANKEIKVTEKCFIISSF